MYETASKLGEWLIDSFGKRKRFRPVALYLYLKCTSHKLGNLRQKVVLYKAGKFFQTGLAQVVWKAVQILHERLDDSLYKPMSYWKYFR